MASPASDPVANDILTALKDTPFACSKLDRLSGGHANWTYRGHLVNALENGQNSVVIKHAEGYIPSNPDYKLDVGRADYERILLSALTPRPPSVSGAFAVRTPALLHSLPQTIVIEDLPGSLTVKAYLSQHGDTITPDTAYALGAALGTWLREYHAFLNAPAGVSADDSSQETKDRTDLLATLSKNESMVTARWGLYIGSYRTSMAQFPQLSGWPSDAQFTHIENLMKQCRADPAFGGGKGIHGDWWTGNMILRDAPLPDPAQPAGADKKTDIFMLDFEVSQLGNPAQDLAQCLGELYMVHHFFHAAAPLHVMRGVAEAYLAPGSQTVNRDEVAFQTAMHFGVHIVTIPWRYGWPTTEEGVMEGCVAFGNQCLLKAVERERAWFEEGVLGFLFK